MKGLQSFGRATTSISTTIAYIFGALFIIGGIICVIMAANMKIEETFTHSSAHHGLYDEGPGGGDTCVDDTGCDPGQVCNSEGKCVKYTLDLTAVKKQNQKNLYIVGSFLIGLGFLIIIINFFWNKAVHKNKTLAGVAGGLNTIGLAQSIFD